MLSCSFFYLFCLVLTWRSVLESREVQHPTKLSQVSYRDIVVRFTYSTVYCSWRLLSIYNICYRLILVSSFSTPPAGLVNQHFPLTGISFMSWSVGHALIKVKPCFWHHFTQASPSTARKKIMYTEGEREREIEVHV